MAYTNADTSAKVGFRPYYQTNAFDAAHLSGLGQNHPFKPQAWHLHGVDGSFLGTYHLNRPFDPWELYPDVHATAGVRTLGDLGDAAGNAGSDAAVAQAADELLSEGQLSQLDHDAILDGSMSFKDVLGFDPTDQGSWLDAVGILRTWNSELQSIEAQVTAANNARLQAGAQPTPEFTALTQDVHQHRVDYNTLAQQFINVYRTVMGSVPSGLAGLGIAPVLAWIAGAAAVIVLVYAGYKAFQIWEANTNVKGIAAQAQQTQAQANVLEAQNTQQLIATTQAAQARGDTVTAQAGIAALKARGVPVSATGIPSPAPDFSTWFMTNAKWIALGVGGLVVLGPLSQGLFGRRR